jgi:hypothetical protein
VIAEEHAFFLLNTTYSGFHNQWGEHWTNGAFTTKHITKYRNCSGDTSNIISKDKIETTIKNPKDMSKKPPANCFDAVGMLVPPPPYSSDDTIYIPG